MLPLGSVMLALTLFGGFLDQCLVVEAATGEYRKVLVEEATLLGAPLTPLSVARIGSSDFGERRGTRTTEVVIINTSNKKLTLRENTCNSGGFSKEFKPEGEIPAKSTSVFGEEAGWFSGGIECFAKYVGSDGLSVEITTTNPYYGRNTVDVSVSPKKLKSIPTVTQGHVNEVRIILSEDQPSNGSGPRTS